MKMKSLKLVSAENCLCKNAKINNYKINCNLKVC